MAANPFLINLAFLSQKPTGLSTYALNLLPELKWLQPQLLSYQQFPEFYCTPAPENINSDYGTKGHIRRLLWTQTQLPWQYHKARASLLFSPIPEAPLLSGCRYVVTVHDLIPLRFGHRFSRLKAYFQYYVPQVLRQAEHIISNSTSTANEIIDFYGIPAQKITPILLAYNAQHFRFLNLPTRNYFLYIGRHDAYKNMQRAIAAFATLPNYQDYEFYLAGPADPRYTLPLQEQVRELGLEPYVKFLDYVPYDELPILINQAIALVFPSLWEGFGLPVLEAMACGTPVICSNLSALPEVVQDSALIIDPYSTEAIGKAMYELVSSESLRLQLRQAGLARANCFSWETTGKQTASVLARYL